MSAVPSVARTSPGDVVERAALTGELLTHGEVQKATRAGFATWVGLIFGTLTKLALIFTMLGIFAFAWFI